METLISNLGINWKILIAQLINFAILLYVLKRFLYRPLLEMLEKRRVEIENAQKHSEEIETRLQNVEKLKEQVLAEARKKSEDLIKESEKNAAKIGEKMLADARDEAKRLTTEESKKLALERERLVQDVKKEIGAVVTLAVGKSLGDTLNEKSQGRLVEKAVQEVKNLK